MSSKHTQYGSLFSDERLQEATSQARHGQAQLLGLIANHNHRTITRSDCVPRFITQSAWSKAIDCAVDKEFLIRLDEDSKVRYAQGNLPEGMGIMHHIWVGQTHLFAAMEGGHLLDSSPDCGSLCVVHYTAVAMEVMKILERAPTDGMRRFLGCPKPIWPAVMGNLLQDDSITHYDWPQHTLVYNQIPLEFQEENQ